jgi:hypothetical protein
MSVSKLLNRKAEEIQSKLAHEHKSELPHLRSEGEQGECG